MPKMNANSCIMKMAGNRRMASEAPNPAPVDTPRMCSDTRGLRNVPWNATPERDSPAPTRMTAIVRGSLIFHTTVSIAAGQVCSIGMTGDSNIFMTVTGSMSYRPLNSDMIKMISSRRHSATSIETLFSTFFIRQPCRGLYAVYLHWLSFSAFSISGSLMTSRSNPSGSEIRIDCTKSIPSRNSASGNSMPLGP